MGSFQNYQKLGSFLAKFLSESWVLLIFEVVDWMLIKNCDFKFSNSSKFVVISTCSNFSISLRKSMSDSGIDDGCFALFCFAIFLIVVFLSWCSYGGVSVNIFL